MTDGKNTYSLRYPVYYRYLRELLQNGILKVSSGQIGKRAGVPPSLVRSDLRKFSAKGINGYGYDVKKLYKAIGVETGLSENLTAVVIGNENELQTGLAAHIEGRGILIKGIFRETEYDFSCTADIAVLCEISGDPQRFCEKLEQSGVRGIWNLSQKNVNLSIPVLNLPAGDVLMELTYALKIRKDEISD
ncbi:MAG: hypothetical protein IKS28_03290 [Clostridia bacterium]|nr:hypothetical protein [Clostridia bacterium]